MEYIFLFLVTLGVYSISIISTAESGICISKGVIYCCQDFKNISGECRACIGTFGQNCSNPCMYGYYGHGCRKRCNCSQKQFCDREKGCLFANDTYLWDACLVPGEYLYSDVRESQMIQNTDFVSYEKCKKHEENGSKMRKMCKSLPWHEEERQESINKYSTLDQTYDGGLGRSSDVTYMGHCRRSDTYNCLQLNNMSTCTLPARACVDVNMNDYALMKSNITKSMKNINYAKENFSKRDKYGDQTHKENGCMTQSEVDQSRLFRPYSTVKYLRQVEQEDNVNGY
ncbi:uncharacterized protein LOC134251082 isoform X2 [Saccostrea cucullata]|uniref:uncharacterized protein LOC134251082 isoform X2 n=1 Tax=Saccostrea cuccullata TaxID=36930 RepID=UPI002ED21755